MYKYLLVFMCMFCRSLFALFILAIELSLSFLDLWILNIPLVSSNSSYQYICAINSLKYNWDIFCLQCNIHCTNLNMRFIFKITIGVASTHYCDHIFLKLINIGFWCKGKRVFIAFMICWARSAYLCTERYNCNLKKKLMKN
jgi:hypothetical protein